MTTNDNQKVTVDREALERILALFPDPIRSDRLGDYRPEIAQSVRAVRAALAAPAPAAEIGPEIAAFAAEMQRELDANARKGEPGSWKYCEPESLWNDTMYHAAKMIYAMKHGQTDQVREFAADVANMAMMTRDAYLHRLGGDQ